ncbi:hypothetical protein D9M73_245460 [compost metagenome]
MEFRDSNMGYQIIDDINSFQQGSFLNTKVTSNGLTIDKIDNSWGALYANIKKWSEF